MKKLRYITSHPEICGGKPCFKGTRIPISLILDFMAAGDSIEAILGGYPQLTRAHIKEALNLAADFLNFEERDIPA